MIGLFINNDLHDLSLRHLYLLTNLKDLPLDFRRKKTKKYWLSQSVFTENLHQSLRFVKRAKAFVVNSSVIMKYLHQQHININHQNINTVFYSIKPLWHMYLLILDRSVLTKVVPKRPLHHHCAVNCLACYQLVPCSLVWRLYKMKCETKPIQYMSCSL